MLLESSSERATMKLRTIKNRHPAQRDDIGDLTTRRPLPNSQLPQIDPFLFLNHHGPQVYSSQNRGLPFGPHPHRGFETVTFILAGDLVHRDSAGYESRILAGGIQWMTTGRGIIHSETSSEEFMKSGGPLEILQLWLNLPAKLKMTKPAYKGLQKEEIPLLNLDEGNIQIQLAAGEWQGQRGAFQPLVDISLMTIFLKAGAKLVLPVQAERAVFFYVVKGQLQVADQSVEAFELLEFAHDGEGIELQAKSDSVLLFGHAKPFGEPVVAYGPFVMNTREEIHEAIRDYQAGKFS